jgi:hypothetical protein
MLSSVVFGVFVCVNLTTRNVYRIPGVRSVVGSFHDHFDEEEPKKNVRFCDNAQPKRHGSRFIFSGR